MTWDELTDLINQECRDEDTPYQEAAYRKPYQQTKKFYEAGVFNKLNEDNYCKELALQKQELFKEKQKLYDERTALARLLREQSRREELFEITKRAIDELIVPHLDYTPLPFYEADNDAIVHLTDLHTGLETYSAFNDFNANILRDRLKKYLAAIADIKKEQGSENCHLILGGDLINGLIHVNTRIENKENIVQQIMLVSELISSFARVLSTMFSNLYIYSTPGNHSRSMANKEHSLKGENFDALVPHYMKAALAADKSIHIIDNTLDEGIATFEVRGHAVFATHGDKDSTANVVNNMIKFARKARIALPDIIYMGHRHTNALSTVDDVKVIQSGCVDGMDSFSIDKRLIGTPEQTVTIVTEKQRVKALYDIQLD